ncbi:hypothetical protein [Amnibacterium sp.]|uniref:hypothetical protein n=1 Tax=Amnibacterium sp. TaxID=1872496 RepID=UPI003F7CBE84
MSIQSLAEVLLALVVVGLLMSRQLRWRDFDPARALRMPIVLGAVGLLTLANLKGATVTAVDGALLVVELLLSVGIGALMGRMSVFRPAPGGSGALQTRTGWPGASLWIALLAVRIGFDALGASLGAHLLTQTGVILVLIAASRATAALVTRAREPRGAVLQSA